MSLAAERCGRIRMEMHPAPCAESRRCRRSHFTHAGFSRSAQGNKLQVRLRKTEFVLVDRLVCNKLYISIKRKNRQFRPEKRAVSDPWEDLEGEGNISLPWVFPSQKQRCFLNALIKFVSHMIHWLNPSSPLAPGPSHFLVCGQVQGFPILLLVENEEWGEFFALGLRLGLGLDLKS